MDPSHDHPRAVYEIQVQGALDSSWENWFSELNATLTFASGQQLVTKLVGPVSDQAALRGVLCKLWDLNLTIVSVRRVEAGSQEGAND